MPKYIIVIHGPSADSIANNFFIFVILDIMEESTKNLIAAHFLQDKQKRIMDDLLAMAYMRPLLKDSFLPFSNSAMRPFSLACILNDALLNRRSSILEFGAGISTILLGRLIVQHNLNSKIVSVEHDKDWFGFIQEFIDKESLGKIIELIHAPLKRSESASNNSEWYDENSMALIGNKKFDMVIIDGPPAWEPQKYEARYPAFPFVKGKLSENSIVYLDDAEREGEKSIIQKWEKKFDVKFTITGESLAYYVQGSGFNGIIQK